MDQQSDNKVRSYHIFLLPFYAKKGSLNPQLGDRWVRDTLTDVSISSSDEERKLDYATAQYFAPEARRLLFGRDAGFLYRLPKSDPFYKIVKDGIEYRLLVKKITVTVFDKNIGVMALYTAFSEAYQDDALLALLKKNDAAPSAKGSSPIDEQKLLNAIRAINEYGRRINLPYLGTEKITKPKTHKSGYSYSHSLVADSISLFGVEEDFKKLSDALYFGTSDHPITGYIIKPLSELLFSLFRQRDIVPVIDDRMYVCSLIDNAALSAEIKAGSPDEMIRAHKAGEENTEAVKNRLFTDPALSDKVYALGFLDIEHASCGFEMRESILRRCVYRRWQHVGTIDIVTHHSFVRILGDAPDFVIKSFITQYVYMAIGALMQRTEILWLFDRSAALSRDYFQLNDTSDKADNKTISGRLTELKRRYVYAQNNIFLNQLTVQEQGIEEFEMLKRELYIDDSLEKLDRSINSIYEFTREYAEKEENDLLNTITIYGLPLAIIQTFAVMLSFAVFSCTGIPLWVMSLIQLGSLLLLTGGSILFSHFIIRRKKLSGKKKKKKNNN